jgi:alpha-tubulin suppressor-like RCC1 family protein
MRVAFVVLFVAMLVMGFLALREPERGSAPRAAAGGAAVATRDGVLDAGVAYFVALDQSGRVFGWGGYETGGGAHSLSRAKRPRLLFAGSGYQRVVAGHRAIHVIDAEGVLRRASLDSLRNGAEVVPTAVQAARRFRIVRDSWGVVAAIDRDGALWWWSDDAVAEALAGRMPDSRHFEPQSLMPGYRFVDVCVQGPRVHAVDDQGRLWRSGDLLRRGGSERPLQSEDGQLVRIAADAELVRVACRENASHVLALARDGAVWGYGPNTFGQLGAGDEEATSNRAALEAAALVRIHDGPFAAVAVAPSVSFAIARDGALWGWGRNLDNELGTGDSDSPDGPAVLDRERARVAVAATYGTGVALDAQGVLQAWGGNALGALGDGGIASAHDRPADVLTDIRFGGNP